MTAPRNRLLRLERAIIRHGRVCPACAAATLTATPPPVVRRIRDPVPASAPPTPCAACGAVPVVVRILPPRSARAWVDWAANGHRD
ncbi:MAG: hypothetical protein KF699_12095 [Phycisphaeraceae bacterium]|nr:hypothetical protein [Phycisphaeraceae bacterium]